VVILLFTSLNVKKLTPRERYELIGKLIEEIKLRKYSYQTGKAYISVVKRFLKSGKRTREFLLSYSYKSRSTMRGAYLALKFFYKNVFNERFDGRPKRIVVGGLWAYEKGFKKVFYSRYEEHRVEFVRRAGIRAREANNVVERLHGSLKDRLKSLREK